MGFFPADLKTYRFRSGRGGRWRGGLPDVLAGEVVMAIEVMDAVEGWDETCDFAGAILGFYLILFLISWVNLSTCRYIQENNEHPRPGNRG